MSSLFFKSSSVAGGPGPVGPQGPAGASPYGISGWYVDSLSGNDSYDGLRPDTAFKTIAKLKSVGVVDGAIVNICRGSYFREELNWRLLNGLTIKDYGTGAKPVFDCADVVANSVFSLAGGYTNVYSCPFVNSFAPGNPVQYSVWQDGSRLIRATSIANCDATPGSFYAAAPTAGSDTIYVHAVGSTNVVTNNKLYEITKREQGILVGANCFVYNMHTRRNGGNNGSFESGAYSYIYGVIAEDGVKHNFYMESGTAEYCVAWKADDPIIFGGATMFVSYTSNPLANTWDVLYKNCICLGGMNDSAAIQSGMFGLYAHTGGSQFRSTVIDGGVWAGVSIGANSEANQLIIRNANFTLCGVAAQKLGGTIVFEDNNVVNCPRAVNADIDYLHFNRNKYVVPGAYAAEAIQGNIWNVYAADNTILNYGGVGCYFLNQLVAGSAVTMRRNLCIGSIVVMGSNGAPVGGITLVAENNAYSAACVYQFSYGSVSIATMQGYGYEANTITSAAFSSITVGSIVDGDCWILKSDPLYLKAGSPSIYDLVPRFGFNLFVLDVNYTIVAKKAALPNNTNAVQALNAYELYCYDKAVFYKSITIYNTPDLADNAAAVAAGLPVGRLYRTADVLKIVHA